MKITQAILDDLTAQAKASPRLRMNLDLRNSATDGSQRILNAIEPGSPLPIHRHRKSSETVVCLRGHLREIYYNDIREVTEVIDLAPGSECVAVSIPIGQWHTVEVFESGTVSMEVKDGAYQPLGEEDMMTLSGERSSSTRLRMDLVLRNGSEDQSQRMRNELESGTVLLEAKDVAYAPLREDEIMSPVL